KLLITGGFGKIARYFIQSHHNRYQIIAADIVVKEGVFNNTVQVEQADLRDAARCLELCEDVDTVIHFAGMVDPVSESDEILEVNIKTTQNIFKAAVAQNCRRFIFASSAQTIESYPTDIQIHKDMLVKPKNLYGVSKCFGEALAAYYANNKAISAISLRVGAYEFPDDFTEMNARDLSAYLHPDDFNQLLIGCIETEDIKHGVLNAISNNRYKRLDITDAIEKVRYQQKPTPLNFLR
ncbi:MAG: NAD(P)-dependent oxidoreductase, partial [Bacteroidota bacterium]